MILNEEQLDKIYLFIRDTCERFHIDEGHGLEHSKTILNYCEQLVIHYELSDRQKLMIELASLLHDMCDKKYMNEAEGIVRIEDFLLDELGVDKLLVGEVEFIILNMSYSKVQKNGYPDFTYTKYLEMPFHIVRNADLLCAYELERCMEYQRRCGGSRKECLEKMFEIYENRVSKHIELKHIQLEPAIQIAKELEKQCLMDYEKYVEEYKMYK